jgi:glycosyltransferase involved in cell wall biosynthesis
VEPSITAVVPTYRRSRLLPTALASIAAQRLQPARLVVVDIDAASWSAAAAKGFEATTGISTTYLPISGPIPAGKARNLGANGVRQGWLAFLDDDDSWDEQYLVEATELGEAKADIVATRIRLRVGDRVDPLPLLPATLTASDFLIRNPGITGSSLIIRAEAFVRVGGFDEELHAYNDLDLMIRAVDAGLSIAVNQHPLVEQLIHSAGQVTTPSPQRLDALAAFVSRHGSRMSPAQRRMARREEHRIRKRVAGTPLRRMGHLAMDVALTSPNELLARARRRRRLGGGYE